MKTFPANSLIHIDSDSRKDPNPRRRVSNVFETMTGQLAIDLGKVQGQLLAVLDQASLAKLAPSAAAFEDRLVRPIVAALIKGHRELLDVRRRILPVLESADKLTGGTQSGDCPAHMRAQSLKG